MNILVLNLARFGDLLQSQAALSGLATQGHKVGLVCLENFASTASLLCHIDATFSLPAAKLLAAMDRAWPEAVADLTEWADKLRAAFPIDSVCNLTPTLSARMLGRYLAQDKEYTGFTIDPLGFGVNTGNWSGFLQGTTRARGVSPFNIVDLFRRVAGNTDTTPDATLTPPDTDIQTAAMQTLRERAPKETCGFVALQLGASEDRRRWPVASFAAVGNEMWERDRLCPVLLGTQGEMHLADEYCSKAKHPVVNLIGKTPLSALAATLTACQLLISNDTGTLHLAAGVKTPVLGIFLATAQPWDTGPYCSNCCSLEPDLPCHPCAFGSSCPNKLICATTITPEHVSTLACSFLATGIWQPAAGIFPRGSRAWESHLDNEGFMDLRSLSSHDHELRTVWLREQRHFYRQFLDRDSTQPFAPTAPVTPFPHMEPEETNILYTQLLQCLHLLDALTQQGQLLQERPIPKVQERFLTTYKRVDTILRQSVYLGALRMLWNEDAHNADNLAQTLHLAAQYQTLLQALLNRIPQ